MIYIDLHTVCCGHCFVSVRLHSLPSPGSVGVLASSVLLGEMSAWLEFDLEKHLEVPSCRTLGKSAAAESVTCWSPEAISPLKGPQ